MNNVDRQKEHFESVAARYAAARASTNHLLLKDLLWRRFLSGGWVRQIRAGKSLLEPMCGIGEGGDFLLPLMDAGCRYKGFDYSEEMVKRARAQHPGRNIVAADVTGYTDDTTYDAMVLIGGLHHVYARRAEVVRQLHGCLKDGGLFLNIEPTYDNPVYKWVRDRIYRKNSLFDAQTEQAFQYAQYLRLFEDAGFELVDVVHFGLSAYVFYYNPDAFPALNRGGQGLVRAMFWLDRCFMRSWLGRKFSFATFSVWRKI